MIRSIWELAERVTRLDVQTVQTIHRWFMQLRPYEKNPSYAGFFASNASDVYPVAGLAIEVLLHSLNEHAPKELSTTLLREFRRLSKASHTQGF